MKKYYIDNERMLDALIMYCEGKSYLWNTLFGRKQTYFRNGEWAYSIYMMNFKNICIFFPSTYCTFMRIFSQCFFSIIFSIAIMSWTN